MSNTQLSVGHALRSIPLPHRGLSRALQDLILLLFIPAGQLKIGMHDLDELHDLQAAVQEEWGEVWRDIAGSPLHLSA